MPAEEENIINNNNGAAAAASSSFLPSLLQHQQPVLKPCAKFFSIQCVVVVFPGKKFDLDLFGALRARVLSFDFSTLNRERERNMRAFHVRTRIKKKG
jgi:hypothetical protein